MNKITKFSSKDKKEDLCSLHDIINLATKQNNKKSKCNGYCKINLKAPHLPFDAEKQDKDQPKNPLEWLDKFATLNFKDDKKKKYFDEGAREGKVCKMMLHRGQRKLFLSEVGTLGSKPFFRGFN